MTKVSSRRFYENRQNLALGTALALSLAYLPTPAQAQSDFYNCDAGETTLDIAAFRDPTKFTTRPIIVCNGTETTNTRVLNIVDAAGTPPLAPRIMFIGEQPDAIGTIVIGKAGEAAGVTVAVQDELIAGVSGKGTLRVLGGADVTAGNFYVGVNGTAVGVAEISGQGTTLSARDSIRVGLGGQSQGALTISDGATVTSNNGMAVGVGETGTGTLSITTGGKLNVVGSFITGLVNTSVGVTTVTGAGSAVTAGQDLTVAEHDSSKGTLRVLDGGSASASNVFIGRNATSTGDATVSGAGSTLAASKFLGIAIGSTSTGTLTVANGGTVGVAATGTNLITIGEFGGNGRLVVGSLTDAANTGAGRVAVRTIGLGSGGSLMFSHNQDSTGSDAYEFGTELASFGSPTAGKLLVSAGTTRLTGNSVSFGGTTDIAGGNLIVANNLGGSITVGADGTLTLADGGRVNDLKNNGLVVLATDGVTSFQAGMQGAGDLQKVGTGTATLTGQNTLTGNVFVAAGTLLTTGANLASASAYFVGVDASGNKTGGGTLAVGDGFDITKETLVSGENAVLTAPRIAVASKLQVLESGTVRAAGPGTPISIRSGGEIVLGLREAPGTSSAGRIDGVLDIESGGTLSFAHNGTAATPFAFTTEVTGAGAIRSEAGYTSLRGTMTGFTGAIRVVGGNLALATTLSSAVQIDKGGIFTLTDAGTFTGQLSNAGTLAIDSARNLSYDTGAVSGTGGIQKDGAGTLTLTGTNQASGGVTVNAGRLNGAAAAIGAGPITVNGGTLAATDALTITNAATVSGTGSVLDASALTVGNGGTLTLANSGLATVGGGTATLNVASGGTLILGGATAAAAPGSVSAAGIALAAGGGLTLNTLGTAANPYDFATTLSGAGTLTSRAGYNRLTANLSGFSGETVVSGGTLSLATTLTGPVRIVQGGTFALTDAGTFSGSLANAGTFSIDTAGNKELDVGAFTGTGAVQKDGTGTLTLTGQMAATGGLNVNGGTVRTGVASVGSGPLAINTGATLALTVADAATLASTLTGAGTLQKAGAGTLTYSGNGGGFKGVTQIDAGGLRLTGSLGGAVTIAQAGTLTLTDQGNLSGAVTNNGTLDIDTAQTKTLTASFGGAGALRKSGTGTLTLTGANTLGGGLQVAGGTLAVNDTSVGTGPLAVAQGATLAYASAANQALAAALSGAGTFAKGGTGTLTLTGANTLGGGLQVAGGTLAVTDTSVGTGPLDVAQGATLAYASAADQTLAAALSGAGTFAKGGTGILAVDRDDSAFTGTFRLDAGALRVNGTLGGGVSIANGATLRGTGTVGSLTVAEGGTVAPGNSIGTLRVTGNATFAAGSNYLVEIDSTPGADQLLVGGSATLNGAKVTVAKLSTAYRPGTRFTIVTANGGINGQFTGPVQEAAPFLDLALAYDGTHVYLDIARALDFAAVAQTGNQRAISPVIEALGTGNAIYDAVLVSDDATIARNAFDSLSGEVHASARIAAIEDGRLVRNAVVSRMSDAEGRGVWAQGFYNDGESRASDGSATLSRSTTGGVMGLDIGGDNGSWRFGVAGGYTDNNLNIGQRFSQGHVRTTHATAYAGAGIGPVKAMVGFSYGWVRNTLDRTVAIGDFGDSLRSRYNGQLIQGFGDLSAPIALSTGTIAPFANVAYVQSRSDRFAETGGAAALAGRSGTENVTITRVGMRVATKALGIFSVKADAGWQHSFGDVDPATALNFRTGGSSFAITGSSLSRDAAVVNAEGVFDVSSRLRLSGGYAGSIGTAGYDSAVTARASFAF
jgi:outer membrane autotransporter protein